MRRHRAIIDALFRRRCFGLLAVALPSAVACAKFAGEDPPTPGPEAGTDAPATPEAAAPDAEIGFCVGRGKGGALFSFCDDFDRDGPIEDGWEKETSNADIGVAATSDAKDARSSPRAVYIRLAANPTAANNAVFGRLRKKVPVPKSARRLRIQYDVRIDALTMIGAGNYISLANLFFQDVTCDGGARARQTSIVLFPSEAQLAVLGFKSICGGADDDDGVSMTPKLSSATLAQSGWHRVRMTVAHEACPGGSGPGSVAIELDEAKACFTIVDPPFEAGQIIDLNLGVSAGKGARAADSRFYFDNATFDFD